MATLFDRVQKRIVGQSHFRKNTAMLILGTGGGQAISFLSLLILTRIYTPDDYGLLGVFIAAITVLSVIVSLRYEQALLIADTDDDAAGILILCFLIVVGISLILLAVSPFLGRIAAEKYAGHDASAPLWKGYYYATLLLPLGSLCAGFFQAVNFWAVRKKNFKDIAIINVHQNLMMVGLQILLGVLSVKPLGLVFGQIAFRETGTYRLARTVPGLTRKETLKRYWSLAKVAAVRYKKFPFFAAPSALMNVLGLMVPTFIFGADYGSKANGWFSISQRVAAIPMMLLGNAVAQTFMGEASAVLTSEPRKLLTLFDRTAKRMATFSLALAFIGGISPFVFAFAFGTRYAEAGIYTAILAIPFAAQLVVSPISTTPNLLEKQQLQLAADATRVVLVTLSMVVPAKMHLPARDAIAAYSITLTVTYIGYFLLFRSCAKSATKA